MLKRELFFGNVNDTCIEDGRRRTQEVVVRKGKKHYIDSQGNLYHIETGYILDKQDDRADIYRPRLSIQHLQPVVDTGLRGSMMLKPFTHIVTQKWINTQTLRWNTKVIYVRTNKMHAIDKFGRRYNKTTGECLDDLSLFIDIKTARPWEIIYVQPN